MWVEELAPVTVVEKAVAWVPGSDLEMVGDWAAELGQSSAAAWAVP